MDALISQTVLLAFLFAAALVDCRTLKLPWILLAAGAVAGIILDAVFRSVSVLSVAGGCAAGLALLVVSRLSKGGLGYGDGLCLAVCGIFLGFTANLFLMLFSFLLSGLAAILLLVLRRNRHLQIPFMPFVLGGYICLLALS